jgi:tetratricopeptide (TPR) repeat protein
MRLLAGTLAVAVLGAAGCGAPEPKPEPAAARPAGPRLAPEKLLAGALGVLDRLDDFDEARAAELVFERVNQWSRAAAGAAAAWRPDPLVESLPERLQATASADELAGATFTLAGDVAALRDQRWLADIARVARGDALDDLEVATRLFDWTVRSLALVADPPMVPSDRTPGERWLLPGEILLAGRASAAQRAWIFLQLVRHAGLDGVMLAAGPESRPWLPAVICGGEALLFEPAYGMAVPGPGGTGVATLRQAAADPAILAALALPERPYPVTARDLAGLRVLACADPWSLSRRMHRLDADLRGLRDMRVAVDASAVLERALAAVPAELEPQRGLWEFPWETLARRRAGGAAVSAAVVRDLAPLSVVVPATPGQPERPLFAARVREFRGDLEGPTGAKAAYLAARPSRATIAAATANLPEQQAEPLRKLLVQMKEDAAYWLGVLALADGDAATAVDYLKTMTLEAAPDSRWADAARTNLARALVALGRIPEAVETLRADLSPQRFGSRVLARQLEADVVEAPAARP